VCQEFEIETENDVIPQIAFGFAGGIGNTGAVCGAVVGAVMAIGLKLGRADLGRADAMDEGLRRWAVAQEFRRRFETEMGTINCRELTGADLSTEEGREQYMSSDIPMTVCFPAVGIAYRLVVNLLKETS
jgi:C_GCAxxG_C_C family probable redox protein